MKSLFAIICVLALVHSKARSEPFLYSPLPLQVKKSVLCRCYVAWVDQLKHEGLYVKTRDMSLGQLTRYKVQLGIRANHTSCHTGRIMDYIIEGRVPAKEIKRLLEEQPDVIGLSVPGISSNCLNGRGADRKRNAFNVLLIMRDGTSKVFASYPEK